MLVIFIAVEWWFMYGNHAPTLRNLALKILSQTASSLAHERNLSTFALIHKKTNKFVSLPSAPTISILLLKHEAKDMRYESRD